mgnify:FL=1
MRTKKLTFFENNEDNSDRAAFPADNGSDDDYVDSEITSSSHRGDSEQVNLKNMWLIPFFNKSCVVFTMMCFSHNLL